MNRLHYICITDDPIKIINSLSRIRVNLILNTNKIALLRNMLYHSVQKLVRMLPNYEGRYQDNTSYIFSEEM